MANIPGGAGILPSVVTDIITQSKGASVPGGVRIAAIIGTGARSETIISSAVGGGQDGFNPTFTSSNGSDGRHFLLNFAPVVSNRTQLFRNGFPLVGLEAQLDSNPFSYFYDYRIDISTGRIELQRAHFVNQGGTLTGPINYVAGSTNVGQGSLQSLTLPDLNAPTETWTIKCVSVQRDNSNNPIGNTARFVAFGSVSGNVLDANGNPVVWIANNTVATNSILSFSIQETTPPFREGDLFTIKVASGVLIKNDSLAASYIAVGDINDPTFFDSIPQIQAKHGPVSLSNTLSLGSFLAFANDPPGIMAVEAAPPLPRRQSFELVTNFPGTSIDGYDFIIPLPLGVVPDPNSQIHIFVTNPATNVEKQLLPNKFPFYTLDTVGNPTSNTFIFDNTIPPGGNSFSYSVIQKAATLDFALDGYLNRDLITHNNAIFSSSTIGVFDGTLAGKQIQVFDALNLANNGTFDIIGVSGGSLQIRADGTPPFSDYVNDASTHFNFVNAVTGLVAPNPTYGIASASGQATTIAAGSNGATLPQAIINVLSTTGFPSAGTIYVASTAGVQVVAYTGVSGGNQFTGCTGGTGTLSTGGTVFGGLISVTTSQANVLATGDQVVISGVLGDTNANGTWTITVVDTSHFTLNTSTANAAYISGGTYSGVGVDGNLVAIGGSATATLTSTDIDFSGLAGITNYKLQITTSATASNIGLFDIASGTGPSFPVTNATNVSPIQITTYAPHSFISGDQVNIEGVLGNTAANGTFIITFVDSKNFTLNGSAGNGAYTATTIAVASNGSSLPQAVIFVASTAGFPSSGTVYVTTSAGLQAVTYTGITGGGTPSFTGCSGGTGSMSTGGAVQSNGGNVAKNIITIAKSFVSEHNLRFEVLDSSQSSDYLVLNHNIVPNGYNLRATLIDVKDAPFFDAGWELALASLETQEIDILVTLPQQTISVIFQNALNHCLTMSNIRNRKERVLFLGAINGLTPDNLTGAKLAAVEDIGVLEGIEGATVADILSGNTEDLANYSVSNAFGETYRAVYFFPDQIVVQVGTQNQIIDGFYIAAAAAGFLSKVSNVAVPLTNKILSGFTILKNRMFNQTVLEQLAASGVSVLQPVAGGGRVLWGKTTTQSGFPEEEEISIVFIRDRIGKSLRAGFAGYIGLPEDPDMVATLSVRATALLNSFISQRLITDFADLVVKRDDVEPRQWNISVRVQPTYPVNWIYIKVGIGLL